MLPWLSTPPAPLAPVLPAHPPTRPPPPCRGGSARRRGSPSRCRCWSCAPRRAARAGRRRRSLAALCAQSARQPSLQAAAAAAAAAATREGAAPPCAAPTLHDDRRGRRGQFDRVSAVQVTLSGSEGSAAICCLPRPRPPHLARPCRYLRLPPAALPATCRRYGWWSAGG